MKIAIHFGTLALVATLSGCTSSKTVTESMDVELTNTERKDKATLSGESNGLLENDAIDWQKFFQPAPDLQARHKLADTVKTWAGNQDPNQLVKLARKQLVIGQIADAESSLRTALRLNPDHREALIEAASTAARRKHFDDAYNYLGKIRKIIAQDQTLNSQYVFRYRYVLGLAELGRGNRNEGVRILADLIRLDKTFSPGYAALAAQYLHEGKVDAAEFIAKKGLDRGKPLASLENSLGVVEKKKGNLAAARAHFEKSLKISENYSPAIVNLAIVAILLQEYENAEVNLNRALSLAPHNPDVYVTLGVLNNKTGRTDAAKVAFRRALDIEPEHPGARFNLAALVARDHSGQSEALRLFHEVTLIPSASGDMRKLAGLYIETLQKQMTEGDSAQELNPML